MAEPEVDEEEQSNGPSPPEIWAFVRAAAARRRKLAVVMLLVAVSLGVLVALVKPPVYACDTTIVARRSSTVRMIATKNNEQNNGDVTKGAATDILNDENLVALMKDAQIVERWDAERPRIMRYKDKLFWAIFGKPSPHDFERGIVWMLGQKITVTTQDDSITIHAEWHTREGALRIVTAAETRFMATQQAKDLAMINDGITILQSSVEEEGREVEKALQELVEKLDEQKREQMGAVADLDAGAGEAGASAPAGAGRTESRLVVASLPPAPTIDPAIRKTIDEKKAAIAALEEDRRREIRDAETKLANLRGQQSLGPAHPEVVALARQVDALSQPSAEETRLRADVAALENQLSEASDVSVGRAKTYLATVQGPATGGHGGSHGRGDGGAQSIVVMTDQPSDNGPTIAAKDKLSKLTQRYDELRATLRSAKIELDVAEAAFKYKYTIMTPAELPKKSKSPPQFVFALAGILAGLALFFGVPAGLDLASGRILASWQVRKLGVDILGEIDSPSSVPAPGGSERLMDVS
jgi:uncharacterized protein involved in exopolysaccharide biosynthesis